MRVPVLDAKGAEYDPPQWIEMRGPGELNGGDRRVYKKLWADLATRDLEVGGEPDSPDGDDEEAAPKSVKRTVTITGDLLARQHDMIAERLITGWSYDLPVPCTPEVWDELPLDACDAADRVIDQVLDRIRAEAGPKAETTATTSGSGSAVTSERPLPDSTTTPSATSGDSSTTD